MCFAMMISDGTDVTFSTYADANADVGFSHPRMRMSAMGSMKIKDTKYE